MQHSQLAPMPTDLPFRFVSKTIGRGAYASIKKAIPLDSPTPVFAVKMIHKEYARSRGQISDRQLRQESNLHNYIGAHPNVIEWFASGDDVTWRWIAMEFASGGDLFDKIEADIGVNPDIAQIYFRELIAGVSFIHSKGIAHRDLKPENILMSEDGTLKIADFGMATMYMFENQRKKSTSLCGSPPYIAPEILKCRPSSQVINGRRIPAASYDPEVADIWSCGVILFVLLVGNTPWDEPSSSSWEFQEYKSKGGRSTDPLWERVPADVASLLRGMICVDPKDRFNMNKIRNHPWTTRRNPLLTADGTVADPLHLATQLLANLRIDLSQLPPVSASQAEGMRISSSQPTDLGHGGVGLDLDFDWERPVIRSMGGGAISSTQPLSRHETSGRSGLGGAGGAQSFGRATVFSRTSLADEPLMSQFSQQTELPISLTQAARRFRDIVPAESLARFFSHVPPDHLVAMLTSALHQINIIVPPVRVNPNPDAECTAVIKVRTVDGRRQSLHGQIQLSRLQYDNGTELLDVNFIKIKGDPLEWRRFFKKVAVLCRDGIYVPEQEE
ncbi:Serine/threonine-protein kinase chk1 [Ceratocystis lukuohia]|uniref:Serine/threonine-protein kinase chk1 n=1 Tax=Ceratocystis lukuohia TaxID=2019550 RepID=A0ABR4MC67_9PEZI